MNTLSGKKVLVTGADGFIGSHLTEKLIEMGAKVRAFVYYNSFSNWGWLNNFDKKYKENIEIYPGDIRDPLRVEQAVKDCEIIFHLASLIAIPYSYVAPESYVQTNVNGALNILNACRKYNIEKLIHTSTSEVYGSAKYVPIDESHPLQGQSPYSATKIAADMLVTSYYCSFDLPVAIIRPFNTYGPRQSNRAIIPTIIFQILSGKNTIKLGSLTPTRDFNYVEDTVSGFIHVAESEKTNGIVSNVGSNVEISIGALVEKIANITGKNINIEVSQDRLRPQKSEVDRLLCNYNRINGLTGWQPSFTIDEGLEKTIQWIRDNTQTFKTGYAI